MQSVQMTTIAKKRIQNRAHIIICGYGRSGQNLARCWTASIPYMALDLDPTACARPPPPARAWCSGRRQDPEPDGGRPGARQRRGGQLPRHALGAEDPAPVQAHAPHRAGGGAHHRRQRPGKLRAAGATEVVPEGHRGQLMLASPRAGPGGRADAPRDPPRAGPARRALRPAARLLPRWPRKSSAGLTRTCRARRIGDTHAAPPANTLRTLQRPNAHASSTTAPRSSSCARG